MKQTILDQIYDKLMDNKQYDLLNSYEVNKPEVDRDKSTITFEYLGYDVVMNISITKRETI